MRSEQRWYLGGIVAALLMLAIAWVFLISPESANTRSARNDVNAAQMQNALQQSKLKRLEKQNASLNDYKSALAQIQAALPSSNDLTEFLRELQTSADTAGAKITSANISAATAGGVSTSKQSGSTYEIPVNVTAVGSMDALQSLLDVIQNRQPRAVLVTSSGIQTGGSAAAAQGGGATLQVALKVFVAPNTAGSTGGGS